MYQAKTGIPLKGQELKEYEDFCELDIILDDDEKALQDDRIYDENEKTVKLKPGELF